MPPPLPAAIARRPPLPPLPLPPRQKLLELYEPKLRARGVPKAHFIVGSHLAERLAEHAGDLAGCHVVEPAAGPGVLTRLLLAKDPAKVIALEKLASFSQPLKELEGLVGRERLAVVQPYTLHGFFADHTLLFDAMDGVRQGSWANGTLSGVRVVGMGEAVRTFDVFSRTTSALIRRNEMFWAGPAQAVLCVRDVDFQKLEMDPRDMRMAPTSSSRQRAMFDYLFDIEYLETITDAASTLPPLQGPGHIVRFAPSQRACKMSEALLADFSDLTFWLYSKTTSPIGTLMRLAGPGGETLPAQAGIDPARRPKTLTADELGKLLQVYHKWEYKQVAGTRL